MESTGQDLGERQTAMVCLICIFMIPSFFILFFKRKTNIIKNKDENNDKHWDITRVQLRAVG